MKLIAPILAHVLLSSLLVGQANLVKNHNFEATALSPWTHNGNSSVHNAAVENYDINGNNKPSKVLACTPYSTVFTIQQPNMPMTKGKSYQFSMDLASYWPNWQNASGQSDAGQFRVWVGSQQIYYVSLGPVYPSNPTLRRQATIQFTANTSGLLNLKIDIYRAYLGTYGVTPRCYIDNVVLSPLLSAVGYGTACGNTSYTAAFDTGRTTLTQIVYTGQANSVGLMIIGTQQTSIPFLGCTLLTDYPLLFPYSVPSNGLWSLNAKVPAGFRGPVNVQHLIRLSSNKLEATQGYRIGY